MEQHAIDALGRRAIGLRVRELAGSRDRATPSARARLRRRRAPTAARARPRRAARRGTPTSSSASSLARVDAGQRPQRERVVGRRRAVARVDASSRAARRARASSCARSVGDGVHAQSRAALGAQRAIDRGDAARRRPRLVRAVTATTSQPSSVGERARIGRGGAGLVDHRQRADAARAELAALQQQVRPSARAGSRRGRRRRRRARAAPASPASASSAICSSALRALRLYVPGRSWSSAAPAGSASAPVRRSTVMPGIVRDLRGRAGQRVEQRRLADVRVAGERDLRAAHRRVAVGGAAGRSSRSVTASTAICAASALADRPLAAAHLDLQRIAERRDRDDADRRAGHEAHLEQAAAKRARPVDARTFAARPSGISASDDGILASIPFLKIVFNTRVQSWPAYVREIAMHLRMSRSHAARCYIQI